MENRKKILIAEDENDDAKLVMAVLRRGGIDAEISVVDNVTAFQQAIDKGQWDLIICDHSMPSFDSFTALRITRQDHPNLPFIVMSGTMGEDLAVQVMKAGASDYLVKKNLLRLVPAVERELREAAQLRDAEEELQQHDQRLNEILDMAEDAIVSVDQDQNIIQFNKGAERIFEFTIEEVINQSLTMLLPESANVSHHQRLKNFSQDTPNSQQKLDYEIFGRRKSGELFLAEASISKISIAGSAIYTTFLRDITDRKQAEAALKESEAKYRDLVENSHELIYKADKHGVFTYLNPAWQKTLGYELEDMLGHSFSEFKKPEEIERSLEAYLKLVDRGNSTSSDTHYLSKTGQEVILNFNIRTVFDEAGEVICRQGSAQDLTQRKLAEAKLQESERRFRDLVETSQQVIWILAENLHYTYVNPACMQVFGYDPEEMIGHHYMDFRSAEMVDNSAMVLAEFDKGIDVVTYESTSLHKSGRVINLVISLKAIVDDNGKFIGAQGTSQDITARKQAEEQLRQSQKMQALGTLAGGIAHDFNNVLTPILGNAELLLEHDLDGNSSLESVQSIYQNAVRARDLISQILLFSRRGRSSKVVTDLCSLITEVGAFTRSTIASTITVREEFNAEKATVHCDASQIQQALVNLCVNAGQAITGNGTISISIEIVQLQGQPCFVGNPLTGRYVQINVTDDGCGMNEETLAHIFEPFFTTKAVGEGTGLGLSMVFGIILEHDGGITVTSEPDLGTTFRVFLPFRDEPVQQPQHPGKTIRITGTEHILFVDDEETIISLGRRSLERSGFEVTEAPDGKTALDIFSKDPGLFDLVITDQTMPNLTGDLFAHEALKLRPDIPIILCSGHNTQVTPENIQSIGIRRFLHKPYGSKELAQAAREVLDDEKEPSD